VRSECIVEDLTPENYEIVCNGIDTGSVLYADTILRISAISSALRNKTMIRTLQTDYDNGKTSLIHCKLNKSAWVYCAIDSAQKKLPGIMQQRDSAGAWTYTGYTLRNDNGGVYNVWKKFSKAGNITLPGVRSGGDTSNVYNQVWFFEPYKRIPDFDSTTIYPFTVNDTPFVDLRNITVTRLPDAMDSCLMVKPLISQPVHCDTMQMIFDFPTRIYIAISPDFSVEGTFIETEGWMTTAYTIGFNRLLPDFKVYMKEFSKGETIRIPGIICYGYNPLTFNYIVFTEPLSTPVQGYRSTSLAVRGVGNNRMAVSSDYIMKNIDIIYSMGYTLRSQSWMMKADARGGFDGKDTLVVLTPFADTVIALPGTGASSTSATPETIIMKNSASLADLMPTLINTDSVKVNAIDLSASGNVRVAFTNKSDVTVESPFTVVLFEDNNGDFYYSPSVDSYLGRIMVNGIGPNEHLIYEITLEKKVSFPKRTMFAFIDADRWVDEINENNNIKISGTTCEKYERPVFTTEPITNNIVPSFSDTVLYCYLKDTNKDMFIDDKDSLFAVYIAAYRLHAVNVKNGDSLFTSLPVNSEFVTKLLVNDYTGDDVPEIIVGNTLYSNSGKKLFDFTPPLNNSTTTTLDLNRDGDADYITMTGTHVTIWSGRDSTLLYVNPINTWNGQVSAVTVGTVADISNGIYSCYDMNVSYPRYSVTSATDTVDLTIRVGNAGATSFNKGVDVIAYADTGVSYTAGSKQIPTGVTIIGTVSTGKLVSGSYKDLQFITKLPSNVKRIWFVADGKNRYFECNELDNVVVFEVK
jgi:hypothetical protein